MDKVKEGVQSKQVEMIMPDVVCVCGGGRGCCRVGLVENASWKR